MDKPAGILVLTCTHTYSAKLEIPVYPQVYPSFLALKHANGPEMIELRYAPQTSLFLLGPQQKRLVACFFSNKMISF